VVPSANFLIDSESRLLAGGGNMAGMPGMTDPGSAKPPAGQTPSGAGEHAGHTAAQH
jgi:Cu(I)/Ag(I) efflux system membrane fusion protein